MIKLIIDYSIKNRFLLALLVVVLLIAGGIYAKHTTVDAIPDLSDVQVIVQADYPGQAPNVVENQVTYPLTTALLAVPGAVSVRGTSAFGVSYVYIIFKDGTDLYWARSRVLEYLNQITSQLPTGVKVALGPDATGVGWIYEYALIDKTNKHSIDELTTLQNWFLRFELQKVPGVSEVATVGGMVKQYQVVVNPDKLRSYGITLAQVKSALQNGNTDGGGSVIEAGDTEYMVRSTGFIRSIADIKSIPIKVGANGVAVQIKDIARVQLGPQERRGVAELNGQGDVVGGIIVMRSGENAMQTINNVKAKLEELKSSLPPGVELVTTYDRSKIIGRAVSSLQDKLIEEFILVSLICIIFLFHLRSALVIIISLPIGVLMALVVMRFQGINANIMSLGGIAIAVGAMVDAAVVMVENVHKHFEHAEVNDDNRWDLIKKACYEVAPPLFYSLLIITFSFVPIFSLESQEGKMFSPLAFTKTYSMATAVILSITLIPVLMGWLIRGKIVPEHKNPVNKFLQKLYQPLLHGSLNNPKKIIFGAIALIIIGVYPFKQLGSEFMPTLDEGDILYMPTTLPGISIGEARLVLQRSDALIKTVPEVQSVFGKSGRAGSATDPAPLSMFETIIQLKPETEWRKGMTIDKIISQLNDTVKVPGLSNAWVMPIRTRIDMLSTGIKTPIGIKIFGPDLNEVQNLGKEIEQTLKKLPETTSVYAERSSGGHYITADINRVEAARYGLNINDIQDVIATAIGGQEVGQSVEGRERYPINIRYPRDMRDSLNKLNNLAIYTASGVTIPLSQIATLKVEDGPDMIRSENARLNSYVYVDTKDSDLTGYINKAKAAIAANVKFKPGYSISWAGQYEYMQRAKERLSYSAPFTLLIIGLLLYLCFRRLTEVVIILASLPFSLVGGAWMLYFLGYNMSVAVDVGFIALAGVAAETGVVMLIYLNQSLADKKAEVSLKNVPLTNKDIYDAIVEGSLHRLRPKMMTVCAIIGGLLPILIFAGTGSIVVRHIAAPMVGGMLSSTILTLIVIPCIYLLWAQFKNEKNTK
jgi:Cu(I)/Ag(I) efflux system membrane protein CusA/SilA